jgi:hypothetical protein
MYGPANLGLFLCCMAQQSMLYGLLNITLSWLLYGLRISAFVGCCTACTEMASLLADGTT